MILLFFIIPILSSINILIYGNHIGNKGGKILSVFSTILNIIIINIESIYIIKFNNIYKLKIINWFDSLIYNIPIEFIIDIKSIIMLYIITLITSIIIIYSTWYMEEDPHINRFLSFLLIFSVTMYILVSANNLFTLFLGWEGVGIMSYLLINYWYTIISANKSSIKAILFNKIGDISIYILLALILLLNNNTELLFNNSQSNTLINILILIAASAKSAQIFFHCWLGDAMAGPTPVSALLHAATMVTAGIILLLKLEPLLHKDFNQYIIYIGTLTILIGSISSINQYDIKKIIAFSTCSQLGYMFISFGLYSSNYGYFHLFTHAFFKALLFLCTGVIIHHLNEQDIRKYGQLYLNFPLIYILILSGSLSIIAFPFMSGYYSKELIINSSLNLKYNMFIYILLVLGAIITIIYSIKLLRYTFFNYNNNNIQNHKKIYELPSYLILPLIILSLGSIYIGYIFKDLFILNNEISSGNLDYEWYNYLINYKFSFNYLINFIPLLVLPVGILLSYIEIRPIYTSNNYYINNILFYLHSIFNRRFFFDPLYNKLCHIFSYLGLIYTFKFIDRGILEYIGPINIYRLIFSTYNSNLLNYKLKDTKTHIYNSLDNSNQFNTYLFIVYIFSSILFILLLFF